MIPAGTDVDTYKKKIKIVQDISASDMLYMTKVIACLRAGVIAEYLSREKVWKNEV